MIRTSSIKKNSYSIAALNVDSSSSTLYIEDNQGSRFSCPLSSISSGSSNQFSTIIVDQIETNTANSPVTIEGIMMQESQLRIGNYVGGPSPMGSTVAGTNILVLGENHMLLYSDGSSSNIRNLSGGLTLGSDLVEIKNLDDSKSVATFDHSSGCTFYTDNSIRLETLGGGVKVSGEFEIAYDNSAPTLKLAMPSTGTASYVLTLPPRQGGAATVMTNDGSGNLSWTAASGSIIASKSDGAVMTTAESNGIVNQSTDGATITLPALSIGTGIVYTFIFNGIPGFTFNIAPQSGDRISGKIVNMSGNVVNAGNNGLGVDGKQLQLDSGSTIGDRVTLMSMDTFGWFILDGIGSWVFEP